MFTLPTAPDIPITAYDGFNGSVIDGGEYFAVMPYNIIPLEPPLGIQKVRMHQNGSFDPHDWVEWPQPYNPYFVHFTCIPHPPPGKSDQYLYSEFYNLWAVFGKESFAKETNHQVIGSLGKILPHWIATFHNYLDQIQKCTISFFDNHPNRSETDLARYLLNSLLQLLS